MAVYRCQTHLDSPQRSQTSIAFLYRIDRFVDEYIATKTKHCILYLLWLLSKKSEKMLQKYLEKQKNCATLYSLKKLKTMTKTTMIHLCCVSMISPFFYTLNSKKTKNEQFCGERNTSFVVFRLDFDPFELFSLLNSRIESNNLTKTKRKIIRMTNLDPFFDVDDVFFELFEPPLHNHNMNHDFQ